MKKIMLFALLSSCLLAACKDDEPTKTDEELAQLEIEEGLIQDYLTANSLTAQSLDEGLYYVIDKEGTGTQPKSKDVVKVDYEGFLLDGRKFDSSYDRGQPAVFSLQNVIEGWQLGIPLFKEGGSGTLLVPSCLGYGLRPPLGSIISQNAVLVFNVELIEVQ